MMEVRKKEEGGLWKRVWFTKKRHKNEKKKKEISKKINKNQ
jgi:hypothetical protein